jgi:hypothetical protein
MDHQATVPQRRRPPAGRRFWRGCARESQRRLGHILMELRTRLADRRKAGEGT